MLLLRHGSRLDTVGRTWSCLASSSYDYNSHNSCNHITPISPQRSVPPGPPEYPGSTATEVTEAQQADTAVFYSISSTQKGLAGIDLGNFLIKQVAQRVLTEFPNVQNLITLSPIPGFRSWLHTQVEAERTALRQGSGLVTFCAPCLCCMQQLHPALRSMQRVAESSDVAAVV